MEMFLSFDESLCRSQKSQIEIYTVIMILTVGKVSASAQLVIIVPPLQRNQNKK